MFSNVEDSNRTIPKMRGSNMNAILQFGFIGIVLITFFTMLLPGEIGEFFYENEDLIFFPMFILFAIIAIAFAIYTSRRLNKSWESIASDYSLKFEPAKGMRSPTLSGSFRGHKVQVEITSVKRGKNRTYYTDFFVSFPEHIGHSLQVEKRGLLSGKQNLIGDEDLDKKYIIQTSSDALLRRILANNRLRRGLLELGEPKRFKEMAISSLTIHYVETGKIGDADYMAAVLRYLTDLANLIDHFDRMAF